MKLLTAFFCLLLLVVLESLVFGQKKSIELPQDNPMSELKSGLGQEETRINCSICHSTDYIVRQPQLDAAQWDAEVKKMSAAFGARIGDANAKTITEYLAKNYGSR